MSPTEVLVQQNVPAEMRDGTTLMSDVYRPAEGGPYPVLLTRMPYGKDLPFNATAFDPMKAARNGYIVVVQDVRGRYASEGEFTPFVKEYEDGYDTVEWAAKLPGSAGRVGMFGLSYFGKTQWHAAVMQPPALASMVPGITWGNHLNGVQMRGGAQELGLMHYWAQTSLALNILFRKYREDPEQLENKLPSTVGSIDTLLAGGGYDVLPLTDLPDPDDLVPFVRGGFARGVDDKTWDYLNVDGKYDRVQAPTLHIGGWYDCFIGDTLRQYGAMKEQAAQRGLRPPRLLVGPWTHGTFGSTVGELDFGIGSSGLFLDHRGNLTDYHLRWFDATLKERRGCPGKHAAGRSLRYGREPLARLRRVARARRPGRALVSARGWRALPREALAKPAGRVRLRPGRPRANPRGRGPSAPDPRLRTEGSAEDRSAPGRAHLHERGPAAELHGARPGPRHPLRRLIRHRTRTSSFGW